MNQNTLDVSTAFSRYGNVHDEANIMTIFINEIKSTIRKNLPVSGKNTNVTRWN